jgi:hypothetical protein
MFWSLVSICPLSNKGDKVLGLSDLAAYSMIGKVNELGGGSLLSHKDLMGFILGSSIII